MGTQPPRLLPYLSGAQVWDRVRRAGGSDELAEQCLRGMADNLQRRYRWARSGSDEGNRVPPQPFQGCTGRGTEGNPLSEDEARTLFDQLRGLEHIPFDYPVEGCNSRAHEMCRLIRERGIDCAKVWNVMAGEEPLRFPNQEFGGGLGYVGWSHHVAPIVNVRLEDGSVEPMVFDPSTSRRPLTIEEWQDRQGGRDLGRTLQTDYGTFVYTPLLDDPDPRYGYVEPDPNYESARAGVELFRLHRDLRRIGLATPEERLE